MDKNKALFASIDRLIANIDRHRHPVEFDKELQRRNGLAVAKLATNNEVFKQLSQIIAFAHADSERVRLMIERGDYAAALQDYDVVEVSKLNPCDLVDKHWGKISSIMSRAKVFFLVSAARTLVKMGDFSAELDNCGIPQRVQSEEDLKQFWKGFQTLRKRMKTLDIPYLKSTTSLSHLLLHLGYDCIKPDVIVMRTAEKLGIVDNPRSEYSLKKVGLLLQEYALSRGLRPSIVDMYFLIQEGQSDARRWVTPDFKAVY